MPRPSEPPADTTNSPVDPTHVLVDKIAAPPLFGRIKPDLLRAIPLKFNRVNMSGGANLATLITGSSPDNREL